MADKNYLGNQNSLSVPHIYDLGDLSPGRYTLTLRIDNTPKIAVGDAITFTGSYNLAHAITNHTQTNWNGIIGRIELQAYDPMSIGDIQVYPDGLKKTARVRITINKKMINTISGNLSLTISEGKQVHALQEIPITLTEEITQLEYNFDLSNGPLWNEFEPTLLTLHTQLETSESKDTQETTFGLRSFYAKGKGLFLNHQKVFLRGTLSVASFP